MSVLGICDMGGNTPLIELSGYCAEQGLQARIFAKLEMFTPTGSVKFRTAKFIIEQAEREGKLVRGGTVIEATSGNLGVALSAIAAAKGYKAVIVMPDGNTSRAELVRAYGAQAVITPQREGMSGAIRKAEYLRSRIDNSFAAQQFANKNNPIAHYATAQEILNEITPDIFIAGVGSGGTFTGISEYLKAKIADLQTAAVEPSESPVLSGGTAGSHKITGIGAGFVPQILNVNLIDEVICVDYSQAESAARLLCRRGLRVGISSGAALYAATVAARRPRNSGKNIVTVFADS